MDNAKDLYILDFTNVCCYSEIHQIIKRGLGLPDYYGENWDALWDCLTDMTSGSFMLDIVGFDTLRSRFPEAARTLLDIMGDLKRWAGDRIKINVCTGDGDRRGID